MKLNFSKDELGTFRESAEIMSSGKISYEAIRENIYMAAETIKATYETIGLLIEDRETLEAEIRRLRELYESDDLK